MGNEGEIHPRVLISPAATPKRSNRAKSQRETVPLWWPEVGHTGLGRDLQQVCPEGATKQGFGGQ